MEKRLCDLFDTKNKTLIKDIKTNSLQVEKGDLFVCTMGFSADRHEYVDSAVEKGAAAIVASKKIDVDVPVIYVDNTNEELINICRKFYDDPFNKLTVIGVTGTDGKTSVATSIQTLIGKDICGNIGTNGYSCSKFERDTDNTSPAAEKMFKYMHEFIEAGCKYVVLEASSEAFAFNRINYIECDASVFTNITPEHMNTHKTMENLIDCKGTLFKNTKKEGVSVFNKDTKHYKDIVKYANAKTVTYGKDKDNDLVIKDFKLHTKYTDIIFEYKGEEQKVKSPLLGDFNVYNLAAALLLCLELNFKMKDLIKNIKKINVSGRIDMVPTDTSFTVIVDYAHTPNGIKNVLNLVNTLTKDRIITIVGSAGERDHIKRPLMGTTATDNSDYVIFTSEDPRSEDPMDIAKDLTKDVKKDNYEIEVDRREAIRKGIKMAKDKDIVLILGKGNETYEKLKDKTIYFNDEEEALKAVKELKK